MSPKAQNDWRATLYRDEVKELARIEREMAKVHKQLQTLRQRRYRIQNRATVRVYDARAREAS